VKQRRRVKALMEQGVAMRGYNDVAYAGASVVRKQLANWTPMRAPADAELLPALDLLVARTRDLDRNNGVAAGAFQTLQDNVVGLGLRLAASPNWRALGRTIEWAEEWTRNVEALWQAYTDSFSCDAAGITNFASMTTLVWRSVLQNGEALALPLWLERPDTPYKTCLQVLDSDRLSNPMEITPTRYLRGGIELDDYGRPLAYYIRKANNFIGWYLPIWDGAQNWERIPAVTDWGRPRVLHIYQKDRADQTRGKPILSPVIEQFRMLDSYQRTELQSSIVNALVAGVIETPMDMAGISELMGGDPGGYLDKKNEYRVRLEGGTFIPLWPGDKLTPYTPNRPPSTYPAFVESVTRQIGDAVGLPYELISKDFSKTTYASARAALGEAWRFFQNRRKWMADYWATPVYALWLEEAVNLGLVDAPNFYEFKSFYIRAKWIGPGRNQIDPVKEAQAAALRLGNRTSTLELECAEAGLDWNEVLEQQALEKARLEQLGLSELPEVLDQEEEEQEEEEEDDAEEDEDEEEEPESKGEAA